MKSLFITLTIVLALSASSFQQDEECKPGCISCLGGECSTCFQRQLVHGQCAAKDTSSHCDLFNESECTHCQVGYGLDMDTKKCVPVKIKNCQFGLTSGDYHMCYACQNGWPSADFESCLSMPQNENAKNCSVGMRHEETEFHCYICNNGFASTTEKCLKQVEGCWITDMEGEFCAMCNPYLGYFSQGADGACSKQDLLDNEYKELLVSENWANISEDIKKNIGRAKKAAMMRMRKKLSALRG